MKRRFGFTQDIAKDVFDRAYKKACTSPDDRMVMQNFCVWRSMVDNEAYHLGRTMFRETLKGYISTTRSVTVAKGFARGNGWPGWVYLTQVCGGFLVPDQGAHEWTQLLGRAGNRTAQTDSLGVGIRLPRNALHGECLPVLFTCEGALPHAMPTLTRRLLSC